MHNNKHKTGSTSKQTSSHLQSFKTVSTSMAENGLGRKSKSSHLQLLKFRMLTPISEPAQLNKCFKKSF